MSDKKLKILYLCGDSGIPYWGSKGGSIHMREITKALCEHNCDVTVIARDASNQSSKMESLTLYDLPRNNYSEIMDLIGNLDESGQYHKEFNELICNINIRKTIEKLHFENKYDVIYERYSLFSNAGIACALKFDIPHILEVNAPLISEARRYRSLKLSKIAEKVESELLNGTNTAIAVSNELKEYINSKTSRCRVEVIPNGVRIDHFKQKSEYEEGSGSDFTVGFLGSLKPWHGVDILISSFAELVRDNENCHLLLIGENKSYKRELKKICEEKKIGDKVTFAGEVDYDSIPEYLQRADVLVAPYPKIDNFYFSAIKVFEYMAAGKAIIASNIGQLSRVLTNEKNALLVHPGSSISLTKALIKLREDSNLRIRLGERALIEARRRHTWDKRVELIIDIINNNIQQK